MTRERSESIDSESTWGEEFGENNNPNYNIGDEIVDERRSDSNSHNISNSNSCCYNFKKVFISFGCHVRKLWGTCQMEEQMSNKDIIIKLMLRELIIFLFFLCLFCFIGFGMTSSTSFFFTDTVSARFLDTPIHPSKPTLTFKNINNVNQWYQFVLGPLLDGLYSSTKFGFNITQTQNNPFYKLPKQSSLYIPPPKFPPTRKPVQPELPPDILTNFDKYKDLFMSRVLLENQLYGVPRLRLLRVRNSTCELHKEFQAYLDYCYGEYNEGNKDVLPFGPANTTAWFYQSVKQLGSSSGTFKGKLASYDESGYVQDLNFTFNQSHKIVEYLVHYDWLDSSTSATRAVFIDFTIYNPNVNLFCIVRLLSEMPMTGGLITSWSFTTVKLLRYTTTHDYIVLAFECVVLLFLLYYIIEEILEIYRHKWRYLKSFFNIVDLLIVALLITCLILNVYRTILVNSLILQRGTYANDIDMYTNKVTTKAGGGANDYQSNFSEAAKYYGNIPLTYVDLGHIAKVHETFDFFIAVTLFFAWIKLFKFIGFNRTLSQLTTTMSACLTDLLAFTLIFALVFLSFAQLAFLVFGSSLAEFCSFENSLYSQFRILLGDFKYNDLVSSNQILGPLYLMSLIFVLFFILANMFLAIVNDSFSDVKLDMSRKRRDLEVIDYFKRGYQKMLEKFDLRKRKKKKEEEEDNNNGPIEVVMEKKKGDANKLKRRKIERVVRSCSAHRFKKQVIKRKSYDNDSFEYSDHNDDSSLEIADRKGGISNTRKSGVAHEEFSLLQRRVDRMEHSIGSIVSKIDAILVKLEGMEKLRGRKRENKVSNASNESSAPSEGARPHRNEGWDTLSSTSHHSSSAPNSGRSSHNRE